MLNYRQFRPRKNWVVVCGDPRVKKTKGGIILTEAITGVERVMEGSGTLLKVGPEVEEKLGTALKSGERIVYRGFLKDATFQEFEPDTELHGEPCPVFLLKSDDIIGVLEPGVQVGFFS